MNEPPVDRTGDVPRTERSEEQLVIGLIAQEPAAVGDFLGRTHHPVYCMACRLSADSETRRDWSHEVLLGILEDLRRDRFEYRGPGSFWGWFRKRAYYRLLDEYRRSKLSTHREAPMGGTEEMPELASAVGSEDPETEMERTETRSALESCLAKLPNQNQRKSLELLLFEELPYEGIASRMEAPLNTVRAWIRRGRLSIRKCLLVTLGLGRN